MRRRRLALAEDEVPRARIARGFAPQESKRAALRREIADVRSDESEAVLHAKEVMSARRAAVALQAGVAFVLGGEHDRNAARRMRKLFPDGKGQHYLDRLTERGVAACLG